MASSGSSSSSGELSVSNSAPTGTDFQDNDTHIVTDNGLPSGSPVEMWKFDSNTQTWIKIPFGGSDCPLPMTRGALIGLRNSSQLSKDCHYVITDYNRGTVGAAQILLHAVNENTLSMLVHVDTVHDNSAWRGTYDIDSARLESLHDNLGNDVYGQNSVDSFPWGVTSVTENEVREGTVNHSGGTLTENYIGKSSTLTISSGTAYRNTVDKNSRLTVSGGTVYSNRVDNASTVTFSSGTNIDNSFSENATYNQVGTGYIRYSKVGSNSQVQNGNVNITNSSFEDQTNLYSNGSSGSISNSNLSYAQVNVRNIPSLTLSQSSILSGSSINSDNATRLYLYRYSSASGARCLVSANSTLNSSYLNSQSYGYVQCTNGVFTVNYSNISSLGYISHQSSGTNSVDRVNVSSQGNMRFLNTVTGCRIFYSKASSGGTIYHSGTSQNCYHYYVDVSSLGQAYTQNSTNARHYYCSVDSYSYLRAYGTNTGQSIMYYCKASARGYLDHVNITQRQRFYAVTASSQSIVRQTGGATAANLYYSTFHAYYYLYTSLSGVTRSGLHGYGRESFNSQPATNGIGTRNWT